MKERGFYRTDGGKVYEYVFYPETSEITAFGPVDKFGGGEQQVFPPVEVADEERAEDVIREKLGDGTFEDDWV